MDLFVGNFNFLSARGIFAKIEFKEFIWKKNYFGLEF